MFTIAGGVILGYLGLIALAIALIVLICLLAIACRIAATLVSGREKKLPAKSSFDQQLEECRQQSARNVAKKAAG